MLPTTAFASDTTTVGTSTSTGNGTYITADGLIYTDDDIILLARLIWAESRGECYLGQLAVGNNVVNRCLDTRYPDTISSNIYRSGQYTVVSNGVLTNNYNDSTLQAATDILVNGVRVLPYWTLNFQVGNTSFHKYTRIGNHTFNYVIRNDNLWRIWCDTIENPQYFIDRLSDTQIEIALESMPNYYVFDWQTKTVQYNNVNDIENSLNLEIQNQRMQIDNLNLEISDLGVQLEIQKNISESWAYNYNTQKELLIKEKNVNKQLTRLIVLLTFLFIILYIFDRRKIILDRRIEK